MSLAFHWLSVGVCFVERTVLGSGCLVGLCEGDPISFARNSVYNILD